MAFTPLLLVHLGSKAIKNANTELWELWSKQQHTLMNPPEQTVSNGAAPQGPPILRREKQRQSLEERLAALEALVKSKIVEVPTAEAPPAP